MNKLASVFRAPDNKATYAPAYLTCGTSPTTVVATWAAVTNGAFQVTIDGVARSVTGIDFSTAVTMADVASLIQTALRAVTGGSELVVWTGAIFVVYSGITTSSSSISKLTAGASGTDISGAGATAFMDGDAGATGEVVVNAALGYANITSTSFFTLYMPFSVAHAGRVSVKARYLPQASGQTMTYKVDVTDDDFSVAEADALWHNMGAQDNPGGTTATLTQENFQYPLTSSGTSEETMVPLTFDDIIAQRARIQIKGSVPMGRVRFSVGLAPLS